MHWDEDARVRAIRAPRLSRQEFFTHAGELRGAIATIDEPGHRVHGFHTVFSTRHLGEFDFTTRSVTTTSRSGLPSSQEHGLMLPAARRSWDSPRYAMMTSGSAEGR